MENLLSKTLSGFFWNLSERVGIQVIQFIPTIILARLLAPEQFGLIGMLSLFIALANTFLDSGFSNALIQKKDADYVDECSMFYFNLFIGALLTLALFLAAPLIANFYRQPSLTGLTRALSFGILIEAFDLVQTTRLTRSLDFKTQLKATLLGTLVSGLAGIAAAYLGCGVWSLVIQSLTDDILSTMTLWIICDWRPALVLSVKSLKGMFGFGSRLLLSSLVSTFFNNLNQAFIGKVFSAASLGLYTRASSLTSVVIDATSNTLGRVLYPAFASVQDDLERLKRGFRKSITLTTFVHFPMMVGLVVVARPLIVILFSAKWLGCVLFLQLLCISGLLYPLHLINLDILKAKGRSDLFFRLEVIKRTLIIISIIITYRWGISAMLTGQIVVSVIAYFLNSYYSEKMIGYSVRTQILDVLPSFVISCLMGGGAFLAGYFIKLSNNFILLIVQTGVGAALYLLLHWIRKSEPLLEIIELAKQIPSDFITRKITKK
jgi:teichuronic acid exporter